MARKQVAAVGATGCKSLPVLALKPCKRC